MATLFPASDLLDTFTIGDGSLTSDWDGPALGDSFEPYVETARMRFPNTGQASACWVGSSWTDVECYAQITQLSASGDYVKLIARANLGNLGSTTSYQLRVTQSSGNWDFRKRVSGSESSISLHAALQVVSVNDWVGFRVHGDVLEAWYKPAAGEWTHLVSIIDSSITTGGLIGLGAGTGITVEPRLDNFGGGLYLAPGAPFPSTSVLDDFNRADGGLGASWTAPIDSVSAGTPTIFSNVVVAPGSTDASAYYDLATFGPNCEAYVTVPSAASGAIRSGVYLRAQNMGTGSSCHYKTDCRIDNNTIDVYRRYNDTLSGSLLSLTPDMAPGSKHGLRILTYGNDVMIEVWLDTGFGFELIGQWLDEDVATSYPLLLNAGYIGFQLYGDGSSTTRSIDDFGGGTFTPVLSVLYTADADDGGGSYVNGTAWPPESNGGSFQANDNDTTAGGINYIFKSDTGANTFSGNMYFRWDTSGIPDDATIISARILLEINDYRGSDLLKVVGDYYDFGGEPSVAGDYVLTAYPTIFAAFEPTGSGTDVYIDIVNLIGINVSGYTGIRLTFEDATPSDTIDNALNVYNAENTSFNGPCLIVTYTAPPQEPTTAYFIPRYQIV